MISQDPIPHGTPEWFAAHKGRLTASMAPAILCPGEPGVYGNPLTAWWSLTGKDEPDEDEDDAEFAGDDDEEDMPPSLAAEYGLETQEVHAKMLAKRSGIEWSVLEPGLYVHPSINWLGASPDAIGSYNGREICGEFKAPTNLRIVRALRHGIPMPYVVQATVQMIVLDVQQCVVSVLYPPTPTWQIVQRAPDLERWVMDGLQKFWDECVIPDIPPQSSMAWLDDRGSRALEAMYPVRESSVCAFERGSEGERVAREYRELKLRMGVDEKYAKALKAQLVELSGGAGRILLPEGDGFVRSTSPRQLKAREARVIDVTSLRYAKAGNL